MRILITSLTLFLISIIIIPICLIDYGPSTKIQGLNINSSTENPDTSHMGEVAEVKAIPSNVTIIPPWNYYLPQKPQSFGTPILPPSNALIVVTELRAVEKGNETPGAVTEATFIDYTGEDIALKQTLTLSIIALVVIGVYLISKYNKRIITRIAGM